MPTQRAWCLGPGSGRGKGGRGEEEEVREVSRAADGKVPGREALEKEDKLTLHDKIVLSRGKRTKKSRGKRWALHSLRMPCNCARCLEPWTLS